jgi:hypothetical protein
VAIRGAIGVTSTGYAEAIRVIESGRIPIERMHTHDFRLRDAEEAILTLAGEAPGPRSIHSCRAATPPSWAFTSTPPGTSRGA